jgi:hypothetical protein
MVDFAVVALVTLAVVFLWNLLVRGAYAPRLETVAPGLQIIYALQ